MKNGINEKGRIVAPPPLVNFRAMKLSSARLCIPRYVKRILEVFDNSHQGILLEVSQAQLTAPPSLSDHDPEEHAPPPTQSIPAFRHSACMTNHLQTALTDFVHNNPARP
jgi:hypothetical protein